MKAFMLAAALCLAAIPTAMAAPAQPPGRIMGARTQLHRFLDCNITVIVLANTDAVDTDEFVASIGSEVLRAADCAKGR